MTTGRRVPRQLHPLAWWVWALALAAAASRTTNPLLLGLILAVLGLVVASRRGESPWARAFKYYLALALLVIVIRVVFRTVFGGDAGGPGSHTLFRLPQVPLPRWMAGIQVGGPVTLEGTLSAVYGGLQLGTLLCCLGAANALANARRALRLLPGALSELSTSVVVAFTVAPQLVESVQRVRRARRLRGDGGGRLGARRALGRIAVPVLEDALERSLQLAAAMDSRGYGRTGGTSRPARRAASALTVGGLVLLCAGAFGLLDPAAPGWLPVPALAAGVFACCAGLAAGSRIQRRTRYRPDPWLWPEWAVVASGLVTAAVLLAGWGAAPGALAPSIAPLVWPPFPLLPALAVLAALAAAVAAPPPARPLGAGGRRAGRQTEPVSGFGPTRITTGATR